MTNAPAGELRLADVSTYLAVVRTGSVTATARELRVTPSQVSKAIVRLETYARRRLLARKSRGVAPTVEATALLPRFQELLETARAVREKGTAQTLLTIAAPSYLATTLVPMIAGALEDVRLRTMEVGDSFIRAYAGDDMFQLALTLSPQSLTKSWVSTKVGVVRQGFFVEPALAAKLGPAPTREKLRGIPFVMPFYHANGQFVPGDDGCPIPRAERVSGHEVPTVAVALEIAAVTGQIAYGPEIAARSIVQAGRLVELDVPESGRSVDLYLHASADRVLAKTHADLVRVLEANVGEAAPTSGASVSSRETRVSPKTRGRRAAVR